MLKEFNKKTFYGRFQIHDHTWVHNTLGPRAGVKLVDISLPCTNPDTGYREPINNIVLDAPVIIPFNPYQDKEDSDLFALYLAQNLLDMITECTAGEMERILHECHLKNLPNKSFLECVKEAVDFLPRTYLLDSIAEDIQSINMMLEEKHKNRISYKNDRQIVDMFQKLVKHDLSIPPNQEASKQVEFIKYHRLPILTEMISTIRYFLDQDDVASGRTLKRSETPDWWYNLEDYRERLRQQNDKGPENPSLN